MNDYHQELLVPKSKLKLKPPSRPHARKLSPLGCFMYPMPFLVDQSTKAERVYPAQMHKDLTRDLILLYTDPQELVLDPFCGSGIVLEQALAHDRKTLGFDINPGGIEVTNQRIGRSDLAHVADARSLPIPDNSVEMILTSPPYGLAHMIRYSDEPMALENAKDYSIFRVGLKQALQECFRVLKPDRAALFITMDRTHSAFHTGAYPILAYLIVDAIEAGFIYHCRGIRWYIRATMRPMGPERLRKFLPNFEDVVVFIKPEDQKL